MTDATTPATPTTCPACGAAASGRFCTQCGASLAARPCTRCQAPLRPGARFCHKCGTPASGAAATREPDAPLAPALTGPTNKTPWLVVGLIIISVIAFVTLQGVNKNNPPPAPAPGQAAAPFAGGAGAAGGAGGAGAVDLASMTPVERFNRLFNRIMRAAGAGDSAQAMQFAPMALQAYEMLDTSEHDADTRLHLGLIQLVQKDAKAVRATADGILKDNPDHLFGYILRGDAARLAGDQKALQQAVADFQAKEKKELARTDRPEYQEHQPLLDEFRQQIGK